jgi:DNA-binding beta-propeller fold protein YncE
VAVSPDGKRTYVTYGATIVERGVGGQSNGSFISDAQGQTWMVTGGYGAVSVVDTDTTSANYNKEIARIIMPLAAQDLAVSGTNLYITNWDNKTVMIANTATNALVGSFTTDQTSSGRAAIYLPDDFYPLVYVPSYSRYITVGPNGTVYVTDYADGKVYAVTPGSPSV